uniref:Uncharacterized protein n=1 Tax=Anopheles albimanus TaxID=7167 RepID=A0A182FUM3_ANOAL
MMSYEKRSTFFVYRRTPLYPLRRRLLRKNVLLDLRLTNVNCSGVSSGSGTSLGVTSFGGSSMTSESNDGIEAT